MTIKTIQVGPIMTNCYLLCDEASGRCALIDPGDDAALAFFSHIIKHVYYIHCLK